jgi:hypothetical protein
MSKQTEVKAADGSGKGLSASADMAGSFQGIDPNVVNAAAQAFMQFMQNQQQKPLAPPSAPAGASATSTTQLPTGVSQIPADKIEMFAKLAESIGDLKLAAALRGTEIKATWGQKAKAVGEHPIKIKHVVYGVLGAALLLLVWEGVAYKMDLPRMGFFGPSKSGMKR